MPFPTFLSAWAQAVSARRSASVSRSAQREPGGLGRQVAGQWRRLCETCLKLALQRGRVVGAGDGAAARCRPGAIPRPAGSPRPGPAMASSPRDPRCGWPTRAAPSARRSGRASKRATSSREGQECAGTPRVIRPHAVPPLSDRRRRGADRQRSLALRCEAPSARVLSDLAIQRLDSLFSVNAARQS